MNNSLYEITREYLEAFDHLEVDEETGEILNFEAVDALAGVFEEKAESVALSLIHICFSVIKIQH